MKYVIGDGMVFKFDGKDVEPLDRTYIPINRVFVILEDGELNGNPVHEGDVIFTLYERKDNVKFIISRDPVAKRLALEELERRKKFVEDEACNDCEAV